MKEGYIQGKIAELNDKMEKINQMISIQEARLNQLYERSGEYKDLLKKLKNVQEFKDQSIKQINSKNEELISENINSLSEKNQKFINEVLENKSLKINEALDLLYKREDEVEKQLNLLEDHAKKIIYLIEFNEILMMKLVNKGILLGHDINDLEKRSKKKAGLM